MICFLLVAVVNTSNSLDAALSQFRSCHYYSNCDECVYAVFPYMQYEWEKRLHQYLSMQ